PGPPSECGVRSAECGVPSPPRHRGGEGTPHSALRTPHSTSSTCPLVQVLYSISCDSKPFMVTLVYHEDRRTSKTLARLLFFKEGPARPLTPPERRALPMNTLLPAPNATVERLCVHHWIIDAPHRGEI